MAGRGAAGRPPESELSGDIAMVCSKAQAAQLGMAFICGFMAAVAVTRPDPDVFCKHHRGLPSTIKLREVDVPVVHTYTSSSGANSSP